MRRNFVFIASVFFTLLLCWECSAPDEGLSKEVSGTASAVAPSAKRQVPSMPAGKIPVRSSLPASKIPVRASVAPTIKKPGAIVVPQENCGTYHTGWVDTPGADVNPCPGACERGERLALDEYKNGDTTQYEATYQCYMPEVVVNQPSWALNKLKEDGKPRQNCGTFWTGRVDDPNADVNPCPSNCERGELINITRSRSYDGSQVYYELNYQCYVAEPDESKPRAGDQPDGSPGSPHHEDSNGPGPKPNAGDQPGSKPDAASSEQALNSTPQSQPEKSAVAQSRGIISGSASAAPSGNTNTVQTVSGTPQGAQVAGTETASSASAVETSQSVKVPASERPISTGNIEGPGTTINSITDITSTSLKVSWKPVTGASGYTLHAVAKGLNLKVDGAEVNQPRKLLMNLTASLNGLAPETEHTVWVSVRYADGRTGVSDEKSVTMLEGKNPEGFKATPIGPGAVRLEWQATPGAVSYYVQGSNLPRRQTTQTYEIVTGLPSGTHEWALIAVYPGGLYNDINASRTSYLAETRSEMVERAFNAGQAKYPNAGPDPEHWKRLALATTMDYDQLVNSFASIWIVTQAYQYLLDRDATAQEADRYISLLNAGRHWHEIWREVAQSAERDQRYGYWAPAPMTDVSQARQVFNQPGLKNAQACFGGLGDGCDSPEVGDPTWETGFELPDGTRMAFIEINGVVGSILHDNACLRNSEGLHCDNQAWHWIVEKIPIAASAVTDAAIEWNKAFWNFTDGRKWRMRFGPYPVDKNLRRANWFDDLRVVSSRTAYMAPVYANITTPDQTVRYNGTETKSSHALAAPPGTSLDSKDAQFCRSGIFLKIESAFGKADWGICK